MLFRVKFSPKNPCLCKLFDKFQVWSKEAEILREGSYPLPPPFHVSGFTCHMSDVRCHISHVTCHMSHVTCHVSQVTCHVSHVMCHIFISIYIFLLLPLLFRKSGEARCWRVCYQRGLPCLVFMLPDE